MILYVYLCVWHSQTQGKAAAAGTAPAPACSHQTQVPFHALHFPPAIPSHFLDFALSLPLGSAPRALSFAWSPLCLPCMPGLLPWTFLCWLGALLLRPFCSLHHCPVMFTHDGPVMQPVLSACRFFLSASFCQTLPGSDNTDKPVTDLYCHWTKPYWEKERAALCCCLFFLSPKPQANMTD